MSQSQYDGYELDYPMSAAASAASERAAFIRRVYAHLAGSVLVMIALCTVLVQVLTLQDVGKFLGNNPWMLLVMLVVFMGSGFLARIWAQSQSSAAMQYAGLGLYIGVQALFFTPMLLFVVDYLKQPDLLVQAGVLTGAVFGGLTLSVFVTKKDYSFMGPILSVGSLIALGVIICAIIFGFSLGLFFSFAMVALIAGFILYDTSNVIHHYPTNMHVAAALELFANAAILFWYILRILIAVSGNRD